MRLPKFRNAVFAAVILGIAVPLIAMAAFQLQPFSRSEFGWPHWLPYVWPTSVFVFSFDSADPLFQSPRLGWSIVFNVLLYLMVFSLLWSLGWVFQAWRRSVRDGTTI
jgi:hypothetical protein